MMSSNLFFLRSFRHRAKTTVQIMLNLILLLMALDVVCSAPNLIPNQSDYDEISMNSYSDYEYDLQDLSTALQKNPVGSELSIVPEKYVSCTLEINDESNTDGHIFRRQAECSTKNDQKGKNPCIKNDRHPNHVTCPRTRFNSNWEELVNCVPGKSLLPFVITFHS